MLACPHRLLDGADSTGWQPRRRHLGVIQDRRRLLLVEMHNARCSAQPLSLGGSGVLKLCNGSDSSEPW